MRSRKPKKDKQYNDQHKRRKRHRKLKTEQHEPHEYPGYKSCAPEGQAACVPLVAHIQEFSLSKRLT